MFYLVYLRRELRRRRRQSLLIATCLGVSVGLTMALSAVAAGISDAQSATLRSLSGIGAGLVVTSPASQAGALADPATLSSGGLRPLPAGLVPRISRLPHVASASGGLRLTELRQAGGLWQNVTVDGTDVTRPRLGPLAAGTIAAGRGFRPGDGDVAVVDATYAAAGRLRPGSAVSLAGVRFTVIGVIRQSGGADISIPLAAAQRIGRSPAGSRLGQQVNVIYVAADSGGHLGRVRREISVLLPSAAITSSDELATAVTGSLRNAASLVGDLGRWVTTGLLLAAFAVASLLTIAAVSRRVREFGTLRALGWTTRRIAGQVAGETMVIGVTGAAIGVAAGAAGIAIFGRFGPALSASAPPGNGPGSAATVTVRVAAHASAAAVGTAVLLAAGGAVLAGALGAWQAARLQPADAFSRVPLPGAGCLGGQGCLGGHRPLTWNHDPRGGRL